MGGSGRRLLHGLAAEFAEVLGQALDDFAVQLRRRLRIEGSDPAQVLANYQGLARGSGHP